MDSAERSVIFKLMAVVDPASQTVLGAYAKQLESTQERSVAASVASSKQVIAIAAETAKAAVAAHVDHVKKIESVDEEASARRKGNAATDEADFIKSAFKKADALAAQQKAQEKVAKAESDAATFRNNAAKALEAEIQKGIDERQAARDKEAAANAKRAEKEQAAAIKSYQMLQDRSRTATREIANNFFEMSESAMRFGRGIAAIGLIGEKDLSKITDSLLAIHGAMDVFSGLGKILTKTDQIMQGLTKATLAQAAAQALLNKTGVSSAATSTGGSIAGGVAGGVAGSAGPGLFASAGAGIAAALSGPFGLVIAGAAAVGSGLFVLYQALKEAPKQLPGKKDGFSTYEQIGALGSYIGGSSKKGSNDVLDYERSQKQAEKALAFNKELERMNTADRSASKTLEAEKEHAQRVLLDITHKRHEKEKEIAKTAREAAAASLKTSEQALKSIEEQIKAKRAGNATAREAFGLKSEEEQAEIIDIKKRVDRGDKSVSNEELSKIRGLSSRTDKQVQGIANQRASAAGFGLFDREDDAELSQLTSMQKKLQLEVKQKTEVVVKMDRDIEAEAQKIAKQVIAEQDKQNTELSKRVAEIVKEQADIKKRFFQRNHGGTL